MGWYDHSALPKVLIDDIIQGESVKNIRQTYTDETVEELANGIYAEGLMNPICVLETQDEDGEVLIELVAGARRLRAIQFIQTTMDDQFMIDGIPYTPFEGGISDAIYANAMENLDREDVNVVDLSEWCFDRTEEGISQVDLAKRLNRSENWVSQRVTFWENACDKLKAAARVGLIAWTTAYALSKKKKSEQEKFLTSNAKWLDKITADDVKVSGDDNRVSKPSKKARDKMQVRLEGLCKKHPDSDLFSGMKHMGRWIDGLLTAEEMDEIIGQEAPEEAPKEEDE